ncbi:MAG: amino acid-binding domain protein [Frankiales bacterium]|nr:amino acid-binding domain protein [Frankiales bacterium]
MIPDREVVVAYLLRVVLPDQPGMLGAVATALGEAGADIVSLDVVERGPDGAVDDLLVELPPGALVDRLITGAQSVPGVIVESLRPYTGAADLHGDLELVDALGAAPDSALDVLVESSPGVFRAGWALLIDRGRVVGSSRGAPEVDGVCLEPLGRARRYEPNEGWIPQQWQLLGTELAAAPVGEPTRVVLLGRPGGPLFRASEVLRLGHLAGIAATVAAVASAV